MRGTYTDAIRPATGLTSFVAISSKERPASGRTPLPPSAALRLGSGSALRARRRALTRSATLIGSRQNGSSSAAVPAATSTAINRSSTRSTQWSNGPDVSGLLRSRISSRVGRFCST